VPTVVAELQALLTANTSQFTAAMASATASTKGLAEKAGAIGGTLSKNVTLPLLGVGAAAVSMALDFDKSLDSIVALVGISKEEVDGMRDSVLDLAGKTARAPKELGEALYFVTSSGFAGAAALDILEASAKAAAAGLGSTAAIADAVTSAVTAYGVEMLSATAATDVLTATVRLGKVEADELSGVIGRIIPLSSTLGVEFHEVGAALAVMSLSGLDAAEATTALRGIFSAIVSPSKDAEKAFEEMGLSMKKVRRIIADDGLLRFLTLLQEETGGNVEEMARLFPEIRGLTGALNILGADVALVDTIFADVKDSAGDTAAAFAYIATTPAFKLQQAFANLKVALIDIGAVLLPIVTSVATFVGRWVTEFSKIDESTRKVIVIVALVVAAIGPLLMIVGLLGAAITIATSTVTLVIVALAALAYGLYYAYQNFEPFRNAVDTVAAALMEFGRDAAPVVQRFVETVREQFAKLPAYWAAVGAAFADMYARAQPAISALVEFVRTKISELVETVREQFAKLPEYWAAVRDAAVVVGAAFADMYARAQPAISALVEFVRTKISELVKWWDKNWESTAKAAENAWKFISQVVETYVGLVGKYVETVVETVVTNVTHLWSLFGDDLVRFAQRAWEPIKAIISGAILFIQGIIDVVLGVISGDWSRAWEGIKEIVAGTWTYIKGIAQLGVNGVIAIFGMVGSVLRGVWEAAWELVKSAAIASFEWLVALVETAPQRSADALANFGSVVWGALGAAFDWIVEQTGNAVTTLSWFFMALPQAIVDTLKDAGSFIWNGIKGAFAFVSDMIQGIVDDIIEFFASLPGAIGDAVADAVSAAAAALNPFDGGGGWDFLPDPPDLSWLGIPGTALGGIVSRPQVRLVGEAGPEAIVPLGRMASLGLGDASASGGGGGDGITVAQTNHFHGADMPTVTQLEAQNRKLGIRVANTGRRG